MVDCMIAAVAYRRALTLLCWDVDMFRVAQVIGIELDKTSLRA
jgi:predicted nucleic acid-binding protein